VPGFEGTAPWNWKQGVTAEGDTVYGDTAYNAFPIGVEHATRANMALEADILLKMRCKWFRNFCE